MRNDIPIQIAVNSYLLRCSLGSIIIEEFGNVNMVEKIVSAEQIMGLFEKSTGCIIVEDEILKLLTTDYNLPKLIDVIVVAIGKPKNNFSGWAKDVIMISDNKNEIIRKIENVIYPNPVPNNYDNTLSDREKEIVKLVARGNTNKEIAEILFLSIHTVITHRKNITAKLGIKTISGLSIYALLNGIIQSEESEL